MASLRLGDGPSPCLQGLSSASCTCESAATKGRAEVTSAQNSLLLAGPQRQPKLRAFHLLFCRIFIFPVLPGTKTHQRDVQYSKRGVRPKPPALLSLHLRAGNRLGRAQLPPVSRMLGKAASHHSRGKWCRTPRKASFYTALFFYAQNLETQSGESLLITSCLSNEPSS